MYRRRNRRSEERRKAIAKFLFKAFLGGAAFALTAYYAYETGVRVTQVEEGSLGARLSDTLQTVHEQERRVVDIRTRLDEVSRERDELRALYDQIHPSEEMQAVTLALRERLAQGVKPDRLLFAIRAAANPKSCATLPSRRVIVRTPNQGAEGAGSTVRLGDVVNLTLEGEGGNGGKENWFDPDRPVTLRLSGAGIRPRDISATLPIEDAVTVRGDDEMHFIVRPSPQHRGFVDIVVERCRL